MGDWNSKQYLKFEKERTRPTYDLISHIDILPKSVLDIGCGPGNSTARLKLSFPEADILGIDNSDDMLKRAKETHPTLNFLKCTVPDGLDDLPCKDLIFSNACLHWIPNHKKLFPAIMNKVNDGGALAVQLPLVQKAPFYLILNRLVEKMEWKKLKDVSCFHNLEPEETYDILSAVSKNTDMWETVYYHIVPSYDFILEWYKGSGLKPYLDKLGDTEREKFENELLFMIKDAYPMQDDGNVILKMPRLFFVAYK